MKPANEQLDIMRRGATEIIGEPELIKWLESGKKLRVKAGFDPTAPDLHLGHAVLLIKLRQFQDLGHTIIFLIGDFTAQIGDPSGRSVIRPQIDQDAAEKNATTYANQVFKILDRDKTEVRHNSEWMSKMSAAELVGLARSHTLARLLERDDFAKRYREQSPISIHELLYPIVQGYDSCILKANIELGGTDQKFNLLVGRELQRQRGQQPQIVLTMPLLVGLDGQRKMSKSYDNFVGLSEQPESIYAKLMSISDKQMWLYYDLLSLHSTEQIQNLKQKTPRGPGMRDAKAELAFEITARLHSKEQALQAQQQFIARFRENKLPTDIPQKTLITQKDVMHLYVALSQAGLTKSSSEARRLIKQGGVKLDGQQVDDPEHALLPGKIVTAQIGKRRFAKIELKQNK